MDKPIVIFGASGAGRKIAEVIHRLNKHVIYFVDNDSRKWYSEFCGKMVYPPEELLRNDYSIVMGSTHVAEIEKQLEQMGIRDRLIYGDVFKLEYIEQNLDEFRATPIDNNPKKQPDVLIDISTGPPMCGVWTWSFHVANMLYDRKHKISFFYSNTEENIPDYISDLMTVHNYPEQGYIDTIRDMAGTIISHLPCSVIINFQGEMMYAAIAVKKLFPTKINIISVIHNDDSDVCIKSKLAEAYLDKILCVSMDIRNKMLIKYNITDDKLFYKELPIDVDGKTEKTYTTDSSKPIIIGYAARLEIYQKRVDLLIPLIQILENHHCNYKLLIAGNGSYYDNLVDFITQNEIKAVQLMGRLAREDMNEFWKKCDVFINVSEFEGSSISLLEAMASGVIPVVTEVSGTNEFIQNGKNGYVYPVGDMEGIAGRVMEIEKDRSLLVELGNRTKQMIKIKCNPTDYINFIETLL